MSEETNQLIDKVNSIPAVKELKDAWTSACKTISDSHPWGKSLVESLTTLFTTILTYLSGYTSYVDSYASMGTSAIQSIEEKYPSLKKSPAEAWQTMSKQLCEQIPDSVKETIKSSLLSILSSVLQAIKSIKGDGEIGSVKQVVDNALSSFSQVKVAAEYATSLANNVSQNETAINAATASTNAILNQLGPEAKAKYESLPDATAKAQFIAEEGWKTVTKQLSTANEQISAKLPEPFKSGYNSLVAVVEKVSGDLGQQLPSNEDMLKKINTSIDTVTKYLETLQSSLKTPEDSASL